MLLAPWSLCGHFVLMVFFCTMHDRLSQRGTTCTCSLELSRQLDSLQFLHVHYCSLQNNQLSSVNVHICTCECLRLKNLKEVSGAPVN